METRPELDAAVYLVLQHRPPATASDLSPVVAVANHQEIAESLERLRADGLVDLVDDAPPRYADARLAPEEAAQLLVRRGRRHRLRAVRCQTPTVLVGPEQTRRAVDALQLSARREVLGVDRPPYASGAYHNQVEAEQLGRGVHYRVVYDRSALALPGRLETIAELVELGESARTASGVPMKMLIADRAAAVIPLQVTEHTVERSLLVRASSLLAALLRIFTDLWRSAVPFGPGRALAEAPAPTDEERRILALLASGATDESIGRLMGFSPRTAHRRVRDLTAKLGVETRFQAGVQAVRLGWL